MAKIELGRMNRLKAMWKTDFGMYLEGNEEGKILLPNRYVPDGCEVGDVLDVFLYLDSEERLVATTETPLAQVGEFAYLKVAWVNEHGAFLDWGLMKDLFCPFREQKRRMEIGESYIVHVHVDPESYRIMASAKVERFLESPLDVDPSEVPAEGTEVDVLVWQKTDLGFKVIVDNRFAGLIYDNQIFRPLRTGHRLKAWVGKVRDDGKIDLTLQKTGREHTTDFAETLLAYLERNGGRCRLGDKSAAEDIYDQFQVSKKTYKRAVGDLYRRRLIVITDRGIELAE